MTDAEIDRISIMRDEGKTTKEIAEAFGVSEAAMRSRIFILIKGGEIGYIKRQKHWSDDDLEELIQLKTDAHTVEEMTARFDVSPIALIRRVEKLIKLGRLPESEMSWKKNQLTEYLDAHNLCHGCKKNAKFRNKQYCPECLERLLNYSIMQHGEPAKKSVRGTINTRKTAFVYAATVPRLMAYTAIAIILKCGKYQPKGQENALSMILQPCGMSGKRTTYADSAASPSRTATILCGAMLVAKERQKPRPR